MPILSDQQRNTILVLVQDVQDATLAADRAERVLRDATAKLNQHLRTMEAEKSK